MEVRHLFSSLQCFQTRECEFPADEGMVSMLVAVATGGLPSVGWHSRNSCPTLD
ncbi:hypothetical protein BQ8794_10360 [Mesorhizobium prunaredense]|uniref:Uncharacterized protein n=1 Tax=Mesorhizobium prunaredense TaxID=1631249 RepID=A0A1R3UZC5_9HYPH|nr:hypothetical protein BQ8794_10360 [Mesorhizobium prunaredense]